MAPWDRDRLPKLKKKRKSGTPARRRVCMVSFSISLEVKLNSLVGRPMTIPKHVLAGYLFNLYSEH
jgi:hypothetical protein